MAPRIRIVSLVCITAVVMFLRIWPLKNRRYGHTKDNKKYILLWTNPDSKPFKTFGNGMETFIARNCSVKNCFVTSDVKYLRDVRLYDAILFHGPDILKNKSSMKLPAKRSRYQKYVFVSTESPHYYADCSGDFNNFFNWTWTYMIDSDIPFNYFTVKDRSGNVFGPTDNADWMDLNEMMPIADDTKKKLRSKSKAVAWFSSSCSGQKVAHELQDELQLYELKLDMYGDCGELKCGNVEDCWKILEEQYYFYLAFEDSFAPDYVTEKLLNSLRHYAVPIVRGWTNYRRFMPDGAYLSIRKLGAKETALQINEAIQNPEKYYRYFKWHNHYVYEKNHVIGIDPDTDGYCKLCEMLNEPEKMREVSICERFDEWWNLPHLCEKRYHSL